MSSNSGVFHPTAPPTPPTVMALEPAELEAHVRTLSREEVLKLRADLQPAYARARLDDTRPGAQGVLARWAVLDAELSRRE